MTKLVILCAALFAVLVVLVELSGTRVPPGCMIVAGRTSKLVCHPVFGDERWHP
jgi:hypothetical protein